jgi:hypothetical protein
VGAAGNATLDHTLTDLAVLEFKVSPSLAQDLERRGIQPAQLYGGTGYRKPLLEALILGFGVTGTNGSAELGNEVDRRVHAGNLRVTYSPFHGRTGFHHWSPLAPEGLKLANAIASGKNLDQFALVSAPRTYYDGIGRQAIPVQSHPNQALMADGDSGGPLFFNTSQGLRVAGIASYSSRVALLRTQEGPAEVFIHRLWEPVLDHAAWIEAVRNGDRSGSLVMDVR